MVDNNFFASIDIGSSKIAILLADEEGGKLSVFGYAKGNSKGVKNGTITDVEQATQAISEVIKQVCEDYDTNFHNVSVNISDQNLIYFNKTGHSAIQKNIVNEEDMMLAVKSAITMPEQNNKQSINHIANYWVLDKDPMTNKGVVVNDPVEQQANTLEVNMHIVIVSTKHVDKIEQSIRNNNLGLANIVLNSIASSETYITQSEKDNGVCLLDIGAEVTNISVFIDGGIVHNGVIQSAGMQITQDIAYAFNTSMTEAERLKITYGQAQSKFVGDDKLIEFQQIDSLKRGFQYLSYHQLLEVIERSYSTLFSLIKQHLKKKELYQGLKSGLVLTGGASKIKNCEQLLLNDFKIRSKLGRVNTDRIDGNKALINDSEYGCALGLLLFNPDATDLKEIQTNNKKIFSKIVQKVKRTIT